MFKIETRVAMLVFSLVFPAASFGATTTNSVVTNPQDCGPLVTLWGADQSNKKLESKMDACYAANAKDGSDCSSAPADFKKAQSDAADACGETGIKGDCEKALGQCSVDEPDRGFKFPFPKDPNQPIDVTSAARDIKACPAMAGKDLDKLETKIEKSETKVKELKKKIPELTDQLNASESKTNEKIQGIKKDLADNVTAHSKEILDLKKAKSAQDKVLTDQLVGLSANIDKVNESINQLKIKKVEGLTKYEEAKTMIDLNCHSSASAQVGKMQTDVLTRMQSNTYNRGGFTNILKNIGVADRESWQRVADKYYKWCINSDPTVKSKESAARAYRLTIAQAEDATASLKQQIVGLQGQMNNLRNPGACAQPVAQANGASSPESETCKNARETTEAFQQSDNAFQTKQNTLTEAGVTAQKAGEKEWAAKNQALADGKQELADEQSRLQNLQDFLTAKTAAGGDSNTDAKAMSKALSKFGAEKSAAVALIACTVKNSEVSAGSDTCTDPQCKGAKDFLERVHAEDRIPETKKPANTDSIRTDPPPAPGTTPAPGSATPAAPAAAPTTGRGQREH